MYHSGAAKGYSPSSEGSHHGGQHYELVEGGQGRLNGEDEWQWLRKLPPPLAAAARKLGITSRQSLWRNVMPVIALLLAGTLFIITFTMSLRYIKLSHIYRPAYKHIPAISQEQIDAATSRHLTNDQCLELYPGLFE